MEKHFENGMAVAQFLESNSQVEKVIYPGMLICFLSTCGYSRILHVILAFCLCNICKLGAFMFFLFCFPLIIECCCNAGLMVKKIDVLSLA